MKIPKYVEKLIERRRKLAYELIEVDAELDDWLEKHNIPLSGDYTASGCMIYCKPDTAAQNVRNDIINKE